jgi:hypothetical protein
MLKRLQLTGGVMRAITFALICSLAIIGTSFVSAVFATTLTANALAGLPRTMDAPLVKMAANGSSSLDGHVTVSR